MQILTGAKLGNLNRTLILAFLITVSLIFISPLAGASYTVKNLNVTITLNTNTSAQVTEVLSMSISNESVSQYSTNRAALNLTLSGWQQLIGPLLVEHVINPNSSIYDFKFLPGPVITQNGQHNANIILAYDVKNVTFVSQIAPREFQYRFNPRVFNFEHGVSGEVLNPNATLNIVMPQGGTIVSVYPIPDLPVFAFAHQYANVTQLSWLYGEPLSKFTLVFDIQQSIPAEVEGFFTAVYQKLGIFTYVLIAVAIIALILYIYRKALG
jgi:hypothetical protein